MQKFAPREDNPLHGKYRKWYIQKSMFNSLYNYIKLMLIKGTVRQMKPFNVNNDFTGCEIMFIMRNKMTCQLKWPVVRELVELELELDGQGALKKVGLMLTKGYIYI